MSSSAVRTSSPVDAPTVPGSNPQTTIIEPERSWHDLGLRELWHARELLYFLTWRDIKVRYKQTVLGAVWALIQPVVNMVVFTILFSRLAHLPSEGAPYALFTFAALIPWTYFAYVLQQGGNSLVANAHVLTKVYFPRLLLPMSVSLAGVVDLLIALGVYGALMIGYGRGLTWSLLALPVWLGLMVVTAAGVGVWFAALSAEYRDVKYVLPVLTQIWLYASPVAYSASLVHGRLAMIYALNPMVAVIAGFRWSLLGIAPSNWWGLVPSVVVAAVLLVSGGLYFRFTERRFADVI